MFQQEMVMAVESEIEKETDERNMQAIKSVGLDHFYVGSEKEKESKTILSFVAWGNPRKDRDFLTFF